MTTYELAINEEGEPFAVPPEVAGWRVRRSLDGRGRPSLVHARGKAKGKPLILPVDATHADLLAAAGPGRYRLEAVDTDQHRVDGLPAACTGPLTADGVSEDEGFGDEPAPAKQNLEAVVCQLVSTNARMVEKALEQMGTVMSGVAELLNAAHNSGITSRPPPPVAVLPPLPPPPTDDGDDEDDAGSGEPSAGAGGSGIPEMVQFIIKEAIAKAIPLIFEKLGSGGGGIAGLPLEAILDWRKAVPTPAPVASEPPPVAGGVSGAGVPSGPAAGPTTSATAPTAPNNTASAATVVSPGAPSQEPPPGGAPVTTPAASSPQNPEDAAALLNAHIMQVWQGLSPPERGRAGLLIAQLGSEARAALLAELARLSVPEAIARARAVIEQQPSPTPQLPTATRTGDPS